MVAAKLTDARRQQLAVIVEGGTSMAAACRAVGISRQWVSAVVRRGREDLAAGRVTPDARFARRLDTARNGASGDGASDALAWVDDLAAVGERPTLDAFERFASALTLDGGLAMRLEPFQRTILGDYFAGSTETLILLPKKSGKTTELAALALFHLCTTRVAECVIAAAARDQAAIMLRQASGMIRQSAALRARLVVKQREIVHGQLGGRIRVLAADVDTADGVIPTLALVDELHRHKSAELYGVFRDGLGPRGGQLVTISTAGDDELSPLGRLRTAAYRLGHLRRAGAYRYARSEDGQFVLHEWALDAEEDRDDLALVKLANPASWQTIERLRERHDSPSTSAWQWARFACGVWVHGEGAAIDPLDWDRLADPFAAIPIGSPVWVGWDNAFRGPDTTAIVAVWWESAGRRVIGDPVVLEPPDTGMLDDRDILQVILALADRFRVLGVVYDPNAGAAALAMQMERDHGLTMVEHSQRDGPMALADGRLLEAIRRRELVHSGHALLRAHVLNAVEKPVLGDRFRLVRPQRGPRRPIDALTALSMCNSTAVAEHSRKSTPGEVFFV
ncbi:MAG: terminase large subunit domain-containing protein [Solirubrobacteraceae bacterium]|nr:MAG: hypothetical protein DLM63_00060 [Solirubrobacterales bacterium]